MSLTQQINALASRVASEFKLRFAALAPVAKTGSYSDLLNKPTIPTVPTNISVFANDVGFLTSAALSPYQVKSERNAANGYVGLDSSCLIPSVLLPSFVDDVLEYANLAGFPATGETGKIYVAKDTNKTYRWSGSSYVEISASPGSTDSVTEGSVNLYFTQARARVSVSATQNLTYNPTTGVFTGPDLSQYLTATEAEGIRNTLTDLQTLVYAAL